LKIALVLIFLMLSSGVASAQSVNIDQLNAAAARPGDWSTQLWADTIGPFFTDPFGQAGLPTTVLGQLFLVFNGAIFAIAVAWLGWGVLRGVVATAQDGQALGRSINSAWYPIRVAVGIAGLAPVVGGFTIAQAMLVGAASLGIGAANLMVDSVVRSDNLLQLTGTGALTGAPGVSSSEVEKTIVAMTRANVCVIAQHRLGQTVQAVSPESGLADSYFSYGRQELESRDGLIIRYGRPGDPSACGEVSVRLEKFRAQDDLGFRSAAVDYPAIRDTVADRVREQLRVADRLSLGIADEYMSAVDASKAGVELTIDRGPLERAVRAYQQDLHSLIQQAVTNGGRSIKQHAQAEMSAAGWMGAGNWYSVFAEANAALADAVAGIRYSRSGDSLSARGEVKEELDRFDALMSKAQAHASGLTSRDDADANARAVRDVQSVACGFGTYNASAIGECSVGQAIVRKMIGGAAYGSGGGQSERDGVGLVSPIVTLKNLGDYVMAVGSGLVGLQAAAVVVDGATGGAASASLPGAGSVVGTALTKGSAGLVSIGWIVLLVGTVMSVYVPMIPWIVWISGLVAYCSSVLEALISMPLHSMSHMHTEGEGMGQATTKGYLMILQVFARPAVMLIAFFTAGALSIALGTLVTRGFVQAMAAAQGDSVTGLASILAYLVLYLVVMIVTLQSIFSLIVDIPDRVISYLGRGEISTAAGREGGDKTQHSFMGVARGAQGAGMSATAAALKQSVGKK
jgi:conjugal transfer/type IV secretion protein DotA/TraY